MRLVRLASSDPEIFPTIEFRRGLNVVFARVTDPKDLDRDSHNLGKTFLVSVIDFALLGSVDKDHAFRKHQEIFGGLKFDLTLETTYGVLVTVRRAVSGSKVVSIHVHTTDDPREAVELEAKQWTEVGLSNQSGRRALDRFLGLNSLRPYDYRKGLNYVLRRQEDYTEVFRVSRFSRGKDKEWKPFMGLLLGFNHDLLWGKYELDDSIRDLERIRERLEHEAGTTRDRYNELQGLIDLRSQDLKGLQVEVERFDFKELEADLSKTVVEDLEVRVSESNQRRYTIDFELREIASTLKEGFQFNLEEVSRVFEEAERALPDQLVRSYDELLDFNRQIAEGRKGRLRELRDKLVAERARVSEELDRLNDARQSAMFALKEQQTLEKYRRLQAKLVEGEREVARLREQLAVLDRASAIQRDIQAFRGERTELIDSVSQAATGANQFFAELRGRFSRFVEATINLHALLSVRVNREGNFDFNVQTFDREFQRRETAEGEGTSYKKMLCVAFDLALLASHAQHAFYRFVYHDGVFEGLDNRRKVQLLDLVRRLCADHDLQYILTVIDTDLPRDTSDEKLLFSSDEVIRTLHDQGSEGRLFRTEPF